MRNTRRGTSLWRVALLLLLVSNDATSSSNLVLDPTSRPDIRDGSTRPEQQHGSSSTSSGLDESHSLAGCSESEGSNNPIGSKCPNGAAGTLPSIKQSAAARVRDTLSEDTAPDEDSNVAADFANHFATAATSDSPPLPPPAPTTRAQRAHSRISGVLVLNLKDAPLAKLLMTTLRACGGMDIFRDFFVVVPGGELLRIESILQHNIVDDNSNGKIFRQGGVRAYIHYVV